MSTVSGSRPDTRERRNPFTDPSRRPSGMVAMFCSLHGLFVAWCNPPTPTSVVGCSPSCPVAGQLELFPAPHTSPARFDTGPSGAGGAGSRVGSADGVATPIGALEAVPDALDDRPVAEGAEPQRPTEVDPDDTSRCPLAPVCECCNTGEDVSVATAQTSVGTFCLALCGSCAEGARLPRFRSWRDAIARVHAHAGHLGCTVDDLAGDDL